MDNFKMQRWIFTTAIKNGWDGTEPTVLGSRQADAACTRAKQFLLDQGVSYGMANIWFSGTCQNCGVWSGRWQEHDTQKVMCPECNALQSVTSLTLNEEKKKKIKPHNFPGPSF